MRQEPGSSKLICPYSGVVGDDDEFMHPKDREAALKIIEHAAVQDIQDAFSDMLKGVASKSRGGIEPQLPVSFDALQAIATIASDPQSAGRTERCRH